METKIHLVWHTATITPKKKKCLTLLLSSPSCARPTNLYQYHQGRALLIHAEVSIALSPWTSHTGLLILLLSLALMHIALFFTFVLLLREYYSQHLCEVRKLTSQNVVCHSCRHWVQEIEHMFNIFSLSTLYASPRGSKWKFRKLFATFQGRFWELPKQYNCQAAIMYFTERVFNSL